VRLATASSRVRGRRFDLGGVMASQEKGSAMGKAMLLAIVAAMLLAYAGTASAQAVRGKSALARSPAKQGMLSWIRFWSTHVRHRALYRDRAPPFSWPVTIDLIITKERNQ
jgi:hypothetical protein